MKPLINILQRVAIGQRKKFFKVRESYLESEKIERLEEKF